VGTGICLFKFLLFMDFFVFFVTYARLADHTQLYNYTLNSLTVLYRIVLSMFAALHLLCNV